MELSGTRLAANPMKVTPKAPKAPYGRFRGVSAVAAELGYTPGHVWRVLSGERANIGTAPAILAAHARWKTNHGKSAA